MDVVVSVLTVPWLGMQAWVWLMFLAFVLFLLVLDLGIFHREAHEISMRESLALVGFVFICGLAFAGVVWWLYWTDAGLASYDTQIAELSDASERAWAAAGLYLTGLIVEQTLSVDNVFVMSMIFTYFAVPPKYQHRVLFYGILGVIVLRALMIGFGAALIHNFEWVLYLFSAFLIFTGIKMLMNIDNKPDIENNVILHWMRRHLRVVDRFEGQRFFVRLPHSSTSDRLVSYATPLFLCLVLIEFADLIFAVDSVPAVFSLTQDPFIVYTSNIFAILGLRSLYFVLAAMVNRFEGLKYALSVVLIFIGAKIFLQQFIGKIPPYVSLGITVAVLASGILYSLWSTRGESTPTAERPHH